MDGLERPEELDVVDGAGSATGGAGGGGGDDGFDVLRARFFGRTGSSDTGSTSRRPIRARVLALVGRCAGVISARAHVQGLVTCAAGD